MAILALMFSKKVPKGLWKDFLRPGLPSRLDRLPLPRTNSGLKRQRNRPQEQRGCSSRSMKSNKKKVLESLYLDS